MSSIRVRGMVLIAVLWMVAALSILVTGMTRSVREEARVMALARQRVAAGGIGDAAIHLVLQEMAARTTPLARLVHVDTVYRGTPVRVQIVPLNGLVDINDAPAPLLASLYAVAGGLQRPAAEALAQATLQTRTRRDARGVPERFLATEDLLRVPGVDYPLYARLSRLITAEQRTGGRVNPLAAPPEVLAVLANGNADTAARIAAQRDAGQEGIDTTRLEAGFIATTSAQRFRIDARVPLPDGSWLHVVRGIDLGSQARESLPWRTFYTERWFEPALATNS